MTVGKIICVGLGPGDPELMSVRADRLVRSAQHVAYFRKPGRKGQARTLVEGMLDQHAVEYPMEYPVTTEIPFDDPEYKTLLSDFYEHWTDRLVELSRTGTDVIVLCEGDPFFYGSFMYLFERLAADYPCEVVPGVSSMMASAAAFGRPLAARNDVLSVVPAPLDDAAISAYLENSDALCFIKVGRHLDRVRRLITQAGLLGQAAYLERATLPNQKIAALADVEDAAAPYFSMILIYKGAEDWISQLPLSGAST